MTPGRPIDESLGDTAIHPPRDVRTPDEGRPPRVHVEIGATTHPGKVRPNNEDHFLVARMAKSMRVCATSLPRGPDEARYSDEEGYLMVVADGMGGTAAGEEASALAVTTVEEFALNTVKWFLHLGRQEENELMAELGRAIKRADHEVIRRAEQDFHMAGMGTTLTLAFSVCTDLFLVHAGDSRAYLLRDGEMTQITCDHTLVQLLVASGSLTPEQAKTHRRRNVVTNVIGGNEEGVHAEVHKVPVADGDILLLCTDGLTEPVDERQIAGVLADFEDPNEAARRLVELALEAGGPDNVTAIVARYQVLPSLR